MPQFDSTQNALNSTLLSHLQSLDEVWKEVLRVPEPKTALRQLSRFLAARLEAGAEIYPQQPFRALHFVQPDTIRVVILTGDGPVFFPGDLSDRGSPLETALVGFTLANGHVPTEGAVIMPEGEAPMGQVTSARYSPQLDRVIGLAWVPAALAKDGASVTISDNGKRLAAEVVTKPFFDPDGEVLRS